MKERVSSLARRYATARVLAVVVVVASRCVVCLSVCLSVIRRNAQLDVSTVSAIVARVPWA